MIPTRIHGMIDYATGILLILAPYLFGFATGGIEQWLPMILGGLTIVMSLLTRYETGLIPLVPMRVHLLLDMMVGIILLASPWLFGFAQIIWWPHATVGAASIIIPLLTRKTAGSGPMSAAL